MGSPKTVGLPIIFNVTRYFISGDLLQREINSQYFTCLS
jgi:hypothetical protein